MWFKSRLAIALMMLVVSLFIIADPALWADSKSATIRISCTINPMLEISSQQATRNLELMRRALPSPEERKLLGIASKGLSVNVSTNSGQKYQFAQNLWKTQSGNIKLYSVTAV